MNKWVKQGFLPGLGIVVAGGISALVLLDNQMFDFQWNQALRDAVPGAEYFFRYITEFGGTLTYLTIFLVIFWAIDKDMGASLASVYALGSAVNYYAKAIIANPRPPESNWLLISASHMATPSGHAMSSSIFWGFLAQKSHRALAWGLSLLVILLVGLSRIYLGVHWLGDILTGWLFGAIFLLLTWMAVTPIKDLVARISPNRLYLALFALGGVLLALTQIFYPYAQVSDFGGDGGKLMGVGLGLFLERRFVRFKIPKSEGSAQRWALILRAFVGMATFLALYLGLYLALDTSQFWLEALQYIISLTYGIFLYPWIFTKFEKQKLGTKPEASADGQETPETLTAEIPEYDNKPMKNAIKMANFDFLVLWGAIFFLMGLLGMMQMGIMEQLDNFLPIGLIILGLGAGMWILAAQIPALKHQGK